METSEQNQHTGLIMKELSDIKASLAVNTNETANIKSSVSEIKIDIKDIKTESVTRREFNDIITTIRKEFSDGDSSLNLLFTESLKAIKADTALLKKILYGTSSAIGFALLYAILKLILIK